MIWYPYKFLRKDKMKKRNQIINVPNFVLLIVIAALLSYLLTGIKLNLCVFFLGLFLILLIEFEIKSHDPNRFYTLFLGIILLQWVMLTYFYLFKPLSLKDPGSWGLILIFIFSVVYFIYSYLKKGRYSKLPWK